MPTLPDPDRYFSRLTAAAFSFSIIASLSLIMPACALDKAWSPVFDQAAQTWYEENQNTGWHDNHPVFLPGQTSSQRYNFIYSAIGNAYARGIKIIDVPFTTTNPRPSAPANASIDHYLASVNTVSRSWVQAVDAFNQTITNGDYIRLRIRMDFRYLEMSYPFYYSYSSNPPTGVFTIPRATIDATGSQDSQIMDIANPTIQGYLGDWTQKVLDGVHSIISARTVVQEVALINEASGESDALGDSPTTTSYSCGTYPAGGSFDEKASYYAGKENYLNVEYKIFASKVHGYAYLGVNKGLKASIFYQTWAMDAHKRGIFDLYKALKGTGIDKLHHTHPPMYYGQSLEAVAFSASVANALGIKFDTEFTWAHNHDNLSPDITPVSLGSDDLYYDPLYLSVANQQINNYVIPGTSTPFTLTVTSSNLRADEYYFQAKAALQYGSTGVTWANWTMQEMKLPPISAQWNNIIGGAALDSSYLSSSPGFKTITALPYPASKVAIYISTLGRMACEDDFLNGGPNPCILADYLNWFNEFALYDGSNGSPLLNGKIDIVTDGMLSDKGIGFLGQYSTIYAPYQTSNQIDARIANLLATYPYGSRFKHQVGWRSTTFESLSAWLGRSTVQKVVACGDGNGIFTDASDIGGAPFAGCHGSDGSGYKLESSGQDIWGTADQFRYLSVGNTGNVTISAKVKAIQNRSTYTKAGVMIRTAAGASNSFAAMLFTPGAGGHFTFRNGYGASVNRSGNTSLKPPYWVKVQKSGNTFTAFQSPDGLTWSQVGSPQTIGTFSTNFLVGLAASGNNGNHYLVTSTFSNVKMTNP